MLSFIRNANHPATCMQSGMIFHVIFCQQAFSRRASEWFYKAPQSRQPLLCFPVRQHCGRCIPLHTQPDFEGINHVQMRYLIVFCCFSYVFTPAFIIPAKALIKQHRYIFSKVVVKNIAEGFTPYNNMLFVFVKHYYGGARQTVIIRRH